MTGKLLVLVALFIMSSKRGSTSSSTIRRNPRQTLHDTTYHRAGDKATATIATLIVGWSKTAESRSILFPDRAFGETIMTTIDADEREDVLKIPAFDNLAIRSRRLLQS